MSIQRIGDNHPLGIEDPPELFDTLAATYYEISDHHQDRGTDIYHTEGGHWVLVHWSNWADEPRVYELTYDTDAADLIEDMPPTRTPKKQL